jgi:hypothetical protein
MVGNPDDKADLHFVTVPEDRIRAAFTNCRFDGVRSFRFLNFRADFVRCYRNDFKAPGSTQDALRLFEQASGAPVNRTQSLRTAWQDTPWSQTGPRFNALKNSDLKGQQQSGSPTEFLDFSVSSWTLTGGADQKVVFGKWGAFAEANINPGPESFYMKM